MKHKLFYPCGISAAKGFFQFAKDSLRLGNHSYLISESEDILFYMTRFLSDEPKRRDKKKTSMKKRGKENASPPTDLVIIDDKPPPRRSVSAVLGME